MTIPTPTSDIAGLSPPPGLPDVTTLARLAGEFFAALPGQAPASSASAAAPSAPLASGVGGVPGIGSLSSPAPAVLPSAGPVPAPPAGTPSGAVVPDARSTSLALPGGGVPGANVAPSAPQHVLSLGAASPSVAPHATAPNGLPEPVAQGAPGYESRLGGFAQGVPEGYAAALPAVPAASPGVSTPYYFLGESSPYVAQAAAAAGDDRVSALSFGLPGTDALQALLAGLTAPPSASSVPQAPASSAAPASAYYFVPAARPGEAAVPAVPQGAASSARFDVHAVRRDFPILGERVNGRPLVWFDNAATTQKPLAVIERLKYFYEHENSNIHRAAHELAARATDAYEGARDKVARFLGAASPEEIIFVRGATEAINLVARTWGVTHIGAGDEIIVSHLEHHANIVPWQQLAAEKGAKLRVIPVDDTGQVLLEEYERLINERTKLVSVTQVSNALGTVVPVKPVIDIAHRAGICTLVDGAQSVSHMRVDVRALDTEFFVFSGHKIFGPTGIGVVYGKRELLEKLPPWQGGGNMIADVTFERTVFQPPPMRFEAGTGNIADAVGLGAALNYVERIGIDNIAQYEHALLEYATYHMRPIPGVRLIGTAREKASVLSFVLDGYSTEQVGRALNEEGIAVRAGHHCAQPILRRFGVEATVRPSLAFYNTCEEVDRMVAVVKRLASVRR